jgi:UDPglucose 6-dehydrogenase
VKAYDPIAVQACREQRPDLKIRLCESAIEAATEADALVVVTEWRQFRDLDLGVLRSVMSTPILVDGRNLYAPEAAIAAGFDYTGVGRPLRARAAHEEAASTQS